MIADCRLYLTAKLIQIGTLGDNADSTGKGVATKKRRLGAFHDFDPINVEQIAIDLVGALQINAVEECCYVLHRVCDACLRLTTDCWLCERTNGTFEVESRG